MSKRNPLALVVSPIWKNDRFLRLWTAQTISQLGDQLYLLALPWLVYNITQSGSQMALVFAYEMLPYLVFSLVGGVLSDKWNRRHMLVYGNIFAMIPLLVIYFLYEIGHLAMWHVVLHRVFHLASVRIGDPQHRGQRRSSTSQLAVRSDQLAAHVARAVFSPASSSR